MKILIAVPCMDSVAAPFASSLAMLNRPGECTLAMVTGSLIYESRNKIAKQAIKMNADAVMWFDSDMVFSADTLERMVKHLEEGRDIVSGLYFRRVSPFSPVIFNKCGVDENGVGHHENYDNYPKNQTFEVEGIGFGCVITRTKVLMDMLLNEHTWFDPLGGYGEDLSFCIRARKLGYKVYCDSTIKCGHIGHLMVDESVYEATGGEK